MNDVLDNFERSTLFSVRYGKMLQNDDGEWIEGICKDISAEDRSKLVAELESFSQQVLLYPNHNNSYSITTDTMYIALDKLNQLHNAEIVKLNCDGLFGNRYTDRLKDIYAPFLFDLIEIQVCAMTSDESNFMTKKINKIFCISHLPFALSDEGKIEQLIEYEALDKTIETAINAISEDGLQDLLNMAISLHRKPDISSHRDAVEKIWDALERLKSYYATSKSEKKDSINRIIQDMSHGDEYYKKLFNDEFKLLSDEIGNACNIRHSEMYQHEIKDEKYYDYFFNRCLSLIALAIQYLE